MSRGVGCSDSASEKGYWTWVLLQGRLVAPYVISLVHNTLLCLNLRIAFPEYIAISMSR